MATLRVNPTRMELTRIKRRLVTAKRGHKLLKDKRDALVRRFIALVRENAALRRRVEESLPQALRRFALASAVMEGTALEGALLYPARKAEVFIGTKNILSVRVPTVSLNEEGLGDTVRPYGYAETSVELDEAISTMADLLPDLLKLAEVEKSCNLLADEIEKTRRRVNALEYVMIPQFEETIRVISMKLDENERSSVVRLMKVKEMISQEAEQ
ncbi:MAG: V-type ATP synthase subunit D [Christensenellales bacterium]|jgi:V/A-type H+-transporting ATPase subunit D|nr:V-type ATP synthase subunit D [Clostridiales bacterium]